MKAVNGKELNALNFEGKSENVEIFENVKKLK